MSLTPAPQIQQAPRSGIIQEYRRSKKIEGEKNKLFNNDSNNNNNDNSLLDNNNDDGKKVVAKDNVITTTIDGKNNDNNPYSTLSSSQQLQLSKTTIGQKVVDSVIRDDDGILKQVTASTNNNTGNSVEVIEEMLLGTDVNEIPNIDVNKRNSISTAHNTGSNDNDNAMPSIHSDEEDNNGTINKSKYNPEEWENLSVAKQVQILNQRKIDNYNKACREFDKKIEGILKPYSGEYISLQDAMNLLTKYTNLEIEKGDEKSLLDENGLVNKDLIEGLLKDESKFSRPDYPILNTRVY